MVMGLAALVRLHPIHDPALLSYGGACGDGGMVCGLEGKKSNRRQFDSYGEPYGKNDVIGCFIDCDAGAIMFSKNGRSLGKAFEIPPKGFSYYPGNVPFVH